MSQDSCIDNEEKSVEEKIQERIKEDLYRSTIFENVKQDANLGLTFDYNREKYDSQRAKDEYRERTFGDRKIIYDSISKKWLMKSPKAAGQKYHMKDKDGNNISKKWAQYVFEVDHKVPIKYAHSIAKWNPYLTDDDFKKVINLQSNYMGISKSDNTSKRDKSNWAIITDKNNGLDLDARVLLAKETIKAEGALHLNFAYCTAKNVGNEFLQGSKDGIESNLIPLMMDAVNHMVKVASGEENKEDAVRNMAETIGVVAIESGADKVVLQSVKHTLENSNVPLLQEIGNSKDLNKIIGVVTIVYESAEEYINGEITGDEFVEKVGEKGTSYVATIVGGEIGAKIGSFLGGCVAGYFTGGAGIFFGEEIGKYVGRIVGKVIASIACNVVIAVRKVFKKKDGVGLLEQQIKSIELAAIKEMKRQREEFLTIVKEFNCNVDSQIVKGFDTIVASISKEIYDINGITEGIDTILSIYNKSVAFRNLEEYEDQLDCELVLRF